MHKLPHEGRCFEQRIVHLSVEIPYNIVVRLNIGKCGNTFTSTFVVVVVVFALFAFFAALYSFDLVSLFQH